MFIKEKKFYVTVFITALPIILQSLITVGVNVMDTVMVGNLGETQISATSLANQYISIYEFCCMGLGMGASVLVSRYWGAKRVAALKQAVTIMLWLTIILAGIFTVSILVIPGAILRIYTPDVDIIREGIRYFRWSVPAFFLAGGSLTVTQVLRSIGKGKVPLFSSVVAFFINIFFNYVLIFGKLGAPRMEIAGAALGTVIARLFEFAVICGYLMVKDQSIAYRIRDLFCPCREQIKPYIEIGLPVLVSDTLLALGNSAASIVMGHIGSSFVAANAIVAVVMRMVTVFTSGTASASCIITGQTLGRGEFDEVQKQGNTFLALGCALGLAGGVVIWFMSEPVVGFYNITAVTRDMAVEMMHAVSVIIVFQSANSILTKGVLRGGGDTRFLMVADILFLWVLSVPLGYLAGIVLNLPAFWTYCCLRSDQIVKAFWCVGRLRSGKWIKKIGG